MTERVIERVPGLVRGHRADGRCVYDVTAKRELVQRCQQPGVSIAAQALAHGINANLLRTWITHWRGRHDDEDVLAPRLLAVNMAPLTPSSLPPQRCESELQVVLPAGTIRIRGEVSAQALQIVIDCLSRRA